MTKAQRKEWSQAGGRLEAARLLLESGVEEFNESVAQGLVLVQDVMDTYNALVEVAWGRLETRVDAFNEEVSGVNELLAEFTQETEERIAGGKPGLEEWLGVLGELAPLDLVPPEPMEVPETPEVELDFQDLETRLEEIAA